MDLLTWFILFIVLVCSLYWYLNRSFSYWEQRGVPSAAPKSLFVSLMETFRKPLHQIDQERYQKFGRVYGQFEGTRPTLVVADPELLKNIFVKDFQFFVNRRSFNSGNPLIDNMISLLEGEKWKRVRNLMTPAFTTGKLKKMASIILDSAEAVCQNFRTASKTNEPVDMKRVFGAFAMDVIASTAFAMKIDSHNDPNNQFATLASKVFGKSVSLSFILFFFFPKIFKYLKLPLFSKEATDFFQNVTLTIIQERKRTGQYRNDFLQLMMEAAGETESSTTNDEEEEETEGNETELKKSTSQKGLSRDELVSQCVGFFIGAYDTTASTLAFVQYQLALNPDVQERLIQEIDQTLSSNEGHLTYEDVQSMKYLDSIICETLRFYPPGTRIDRTATADYDLGYADVKIPKGMVVSTPVYAIHHDPEFYPDPEKFDPDRFSPEAKAERNPYTFLSFGIGPRNCLGMRFVLMEIKICLAKVFSQFRIKRCSETKVPLEFHGTPGILMPKPIILKVEERIDKIC